MKDIKNLWTDMFNSNKFKNAFKKGYKDFFTGNIKVPFRVDSLLHKEYTRGFNEAYFKHQIYTKNKKRYKGKHAK